MCLSQFLQQVVVGVGCFEGSATGLQLHLYLKVFVLCLLPEQCLWRLVPMEA
jgi:hypothetical protein